MNVLDEVLLTDILKELEKRFDGYVFVGLQHKTKDTEVTFGTFYGGKLQALGLAKYMEDKLSAELQKDFKQVEDNKGGD